MSLELKGLIVEKQAEHGAALNQSLLPDIVLVGFEIRTNLHKAIQAVKESTFDVCFIADGIDNDGLSAFFSDMRALKKIDDVFFVQVRDKFEEGFDRKSVEEAGFGTVVCRAMTDGDRSALMLAIKEFLHIREIKRKRVDVSTAVELLLLELERVYRNKKRGVNLGFRRAMIADYMSEQLDFHSEVFVGYIEALEKHTEKSQPGKSAVLNIPMSDQGRNLPGMEDGNYVGVSLRVYDMLQEKFGTIGSDIRENSIADASQSVESKAEERLNERLKEMGLEDK